MLHYIQKSKLFNSLLHLVYPQVCLVCDAELATQEHAVCSLCLDKLVYTDFHLLEEPSPVDKLFWGRVPVNATYSHLYFKKLGGSQNILFGLKYRNGVEIGQYFGEMIAERLLVMPSFNGIEALIPVPLHHKKHFLRGYNQSELLAAGIGSRLGVPVATRLVRRTTHSSTQTKKNRFQRWDNVEGIFDVHSAIQNFNHVVLVDDVITTGATLEALIRSIHSVKPDIRISVVTLAIA